MAKNSLRSQYAKESAYIRRRLRDIEKRDPDSMIVQRFKNEFPGLKDMRLKPSDRAIELGLERMKELRESGALSVRASKRAISGAVMEFRRRGYDFVTEENAADLFRFLDDARARGLTSVYGYEKIMETINRARKRGLSDEEIEANIDYWAENKEKGKRLTVRQRKPNTDSANISRKIRHK